MYNLTADLPIIIEILRYAELTSSCEKDVKERIGKAAAVFGKMRKIWRNSNNSLKVKTRLYEAIILSTLLYGADVWPLTATLTKSLDAAHHRWHRSILGISWKDRITNVVVRTRTGQQTIDNIVREDDFAGLDMFSVRTTTAYCSNHCTGRYQDTREDQRANWRNAVNKDLQEIRFTWEEAEVAALDRHGWRRSGCEMNQGQGQGV